MANVNAIIIAVQGIVNVINSDSDSSSDDEEEILNVLNMITKRRPLELRPRIKNYIENVIALLSDEGFKAHFR